MAESNKKSVTAILASVIVAITGLAGSTTAVLYKDRQDLEARLFTLERQMSAERDLRYKSEIAALSLKYKLEQSFQVIDVVQAYIDAMPFPAWIKKRLDSGEFEMMIINRAYEIAFDITKSQYEGRKDNEVWPQHLAEAFKKLDEKVYSSKRSKCEKELVIRDKKETHVTSCKFPIRLEDKTFGVGGVIAQ